VKLWPKPRIACNDLVLNTAWIWNWG